MSLLLVLGYIIEDSQVREIPVFLLIIEPIAHDVMVGNCKSDIIDGYLDFSALWFTQQSTHLDRLGLALGEGPH